MKPRLRLRWHVWSCVGRCGDFLLLGFGYSPKEAYADWERQITLKRGEPVKNGAVVMEIGA